MEPEKTKEFPLKDETYKVLGACFEVYREKYLSPQRLNV